MNDFKFLVITKVPDREDPDGGNLCDDFLHLRGPDGPGFQRTFGQMVQVMRPVFELGEILVVNLDGREHGGGGRKPSKWYVEYEEFDDVQAAIAKSKEVQA